MGDEAQDNRYATLASLLGVSRLEHKSATPSPTDGVPHQVRPAPPGETGGRSNQAKEEPETFGTPSAPGAGSPPGTWAEKKSCLQHKSATRSSTDVVTHQVQPTPPGETDARSSQAREELETSGTPSAPLSPEREAMRQNTLAALLGLPQPTTSPQPSSGSALAPREGSDACPQSKEQSDSVGDKTGMGSMVSNKGDQGQAPQPKSLRVNNIKRSSKPKQAGYSSSQNRSPSGIESQDFYVPSFPQLQPSSSHAAETVENGLPSDPSTRLASDAKTTVIVRNIPEDCTRPMLLSILPSGLCCDQVYMPFEAPTGRNFGFAIMNFVNPGLAIAFRNKWHEQRLLHLTSKQTGMSVLPPKPLSIDWAPCQGREYVQKMCNSTKGIHET